MSKITKLVQSPDKFFKDFLIKRINSLGSKIEDKNISKKVIVNNKEIQKKIIDFYFDPIFFNPNITTVIHCGEGFAGGKKIMGQWLHYLEKYKESFVLLIRNYDLFNKLKLEYKGFNIAYAKSPTDVESLVTKLKKLKNICFVSNTANNIHLIRFNKYKHIYIGHFDEKRQPSIHKYLRAYDECWVYSQYVYNNIMEVLKINHLDVKFIHNPNFLMKNPRDKKNIVYWSLDNQDAIYNSFFLIPDILNIESIQNKFLYIYTSPEMQDIVSQHVGKYSINSFTDSLLLEISDLIVMDYNYNKTLDALKLGVPVIIYMPDSRLIYDENDQIILNLCYQFKDIDELNSIINQIDAGQDSLYSERLGFLNFYFGLASLENHNFKNTIHQLFMAV